MTDDIIVLYGKTRQYRQDNSVVLLTDLIDDYVSLVSFKLATFCIWTYAFPC